MGPRRRAGGAVAGALLGAGALLVGGVLAVAPAGAAERFVQGVDDLPLMPALESQADQSVVFDKPDGRIVRAVAEGPASVERVRDFYEQTLPQLGWQRRQQSGGPGESVYIRGDERLILTIREAGEGARVRFSLSPR